MHSAAGGGLGVVTHGWKTGTAGLPEGGFPALRATTPARGKESLATMFDRLAEAAAAHDGEAAGGIFGEIERALARPVKRLASG